MYLSSDATTGKINTQSNDLQQPSRRKLLFQPLCDAEADFKK